MDVEAEEMEEDAVDLSVGVVFSKNMRNRSRVEALPIFLWVWQWRAIRQGGRGVQTMHF